MAKEEIKLEVKVNIEAVKSALRNSEKIEEAALEVPAVNPTKLTLRSRIYGIEFNPISPEKKIKHLTLPTLGSYPAIREIIVDSLAADVKEGYITVNGNIDIPEEGNRLINIKDAYFTTEEDAREVCKAIAMINLDRVREIKKLVEKEEVTLQEQLDADAF